MSEAVQQKIVTLHLAIFQSDQEACYRLTKIEIVDVDPTSHHELNHESRDITHCQAIPVGDPDPARPDACVEVWAYAPKEGDEYLTVGGISCYYPKTSSSAQPDEHPEGQEAQVRLFLSITKSPDGNYDTLVLKGIATYVDAPGGLRVEPVDDCQDIPAGDPVKCLKVWVPGNQPQGLEGAGTGLGIYPRLGGISYYYPRRR
jgi:hypothetical protein